MTELLDEVVEVRTDAAGTVTAVLVRSRWRAVLRTTNRWVVETDWWRAPVHRDYRRCLTGDGECLEVYRDVPTGHWRLARRYD